jgi:predicted house-cleaning noncanonical NTP pyrophosphatase (MazG superfamily)
VKLVRDRIPELATATGQPGAFEQATEAEVVLCLRAKLLEEAQEAATTSPADLVEELGDVLQVLYALAELAGHTAAEIECARVRTARTHGAYTRRLLWQPPPEPKAGAGHAEPPPPRAPHPSCPAPHGGSPMPTPITAPTAPVAAPGLHTDRAVRLLAAIRVALVVALTALVLAIAVLAYVVSFEAIRAFAIETAAFPPTLAWSAPLLVDSFTTAASLVILWRYLRGDAWRDPWYAWTLVGCATAVSVALNVAHAPDPLAAQLFAALPPVALLGALELLMSVARTGLPHTSRTTLPTTPASVVPGVALDPRGRQRPPHSDHARPGRAAGPHPGAGQGQAAAPDARRRVRVLVARERAGGPKVTAAEVIAATGRSRRRAYELLRDARTEQE